MFTWSMMYILNNMDTEYLNGHVMVHASKGGSFQEDIKRCTECGMIILTLDQSVHGVNMKALFSRGKFTKITSVPATCAEYATIKVHEE